MHRAWGPTTPFPADLPGLTSIRALLALGVVLFHYHFMWSIGDQRVTALIDKTYMGVDVFFILSGFVLIHAYRAALDSGTFTYRRFLLARIARIYPAHVAVLALVLAMVVAARLAGADFDSSHYNLPGFLTALALVHAWAPRLLDAGWNQPSWSLSAEWFAYLAFPLYAWAAMKLRRRPLTIIAIAITSFIALDAFYRMRFGEILPHAQTNLGVLRILPEFLYGIGLYRLGEHFHPRRGSAIALAAASGALMLLLMHFGADDRLIVGVAGLVVLGLALLSKAGADRYVARPWMLACGEASFALYLLHFPLLIAWKGAVSMLTNKPSSYVMTGPEVLALLALTVIAAFALHYLWEAPARRWIRGWSDKVGVRGAHAAMPPGSQPPDV